MMPSGYELKRYTLPQVLRLRAQHTPRKVALREKEFGIWNEITYQDYYRHVTHFAAGLLALGFERGERLAIIADNIPEWLYAELGTQAVGGISVGVYQSSLPPEIAYVLAYTGTAFVLAEDQEQVDKLIEIRGEIPSVRKVIYEDPRGMRAYRDDPWFISYEEVERLGEAYLQRHPTAVEERINEGNPEDVCHLSLTSGTTGRPKAAMLRHRNLLHMGVALQEVDPLEPTDDYLSFLPFAWIGEQMMSVGMALAGGFAVNFPESIETAMNDLKEIGPHVMFSPPRVWEGTQSQIWVRISETYAFNRWVYNQMLKIGYRAADYRMRGKPMPIGLRIAYWLADQIMFKPLRDQLGFLRLRRAYTGGAALGPDVFRFYHAIGVNLKQIYGQTEIIGIAFVHRDGDVRADTVGLPIPGGEVKISERGEILCRSDAVVAGYWQNPEATAETFAEGWLHTGDAGYLTPDGHLVVIDRVSDVMHTSSGHMFSPQFIENKLKFSPYIKEAVVFGHQKPYITAFINVDPQTVGKWAEDHRIAYTTYLDLSQKPQVAELIRKEVQAVNESLPEHLRIQRFVLLYKLLDADDDELTRTGKVRRKFIAQRYQALVEALYSGAQQVRVETEFKYQDGSIQRVSTEVSVLETHSHQPLVGV
ncbi:MAG: long-chain fatty acid--CoA ligase [Meiothermus sp.]|uniref:long-chain fatty acid--CoA ligase n=1 Tax=Meiothermus sp. TaxID=1955249 RepID=UPI0025FC6424|nr:long-chain fatty acid--CoA ligase [Meiothermus sp.]MCS7058736.1 long-chain fatty acid--CoA ligase [Meiothermus sp.]MCS7194952.1 long-chain fatty acid--CoA ligase [Meiothermus sp.]MDW8090652.1 long-chain fatty acid--CoA ligase [Meiothermus sp.]